MADRTASPLMVLDRSGHIRYSNPAASRLVGRMAASLAGTHVELVRDVDTDPPEARIAETVVS